MAPLEKCRRTIALGGGESTFRLCWRNGVQDPRIGAGRGPYGPARRAAAGARRPWLVGILGGLAVGDGFAGVGRSRSRSDRPPRASGGDRPLGGHAARLEAHHTAPDPAATAP